jgi:hypothetical protein
MGEFMTIPELMTGSLNSWMLFRFFPGVLGGLQLDKWEKLKEHSPIF